jgi:DNA-directed RNA polymerase subunit RPC12/RpoP
MSTVACSTCGASLRAPDDAAGRRFKCSQCGGVIVVPGEPMAMLAAAAHGLGVAAGTSRPARVRGRPAEASVAVRPAPPPMVPTFMAPLPDAAALSAHAGRSPGGTTAQRAGIPLWVLLGGAGLAAMLVAAVGAAVVYFLVFGSRVTQANFDRIAPAMTRTEVEGILGSPTRSQDIPVLNVNASVWTDKQKVIVVWYQNDKEINKIITDGQVNVSGPPGGVIPNALSPGKDPVAALGAAGGGATDKEEESAAPAAAAAVAPDPEQKREMEEAFRDAMKTFSKKGGPAAASAPQTGGSNATPAKDGTSGSVGQPSKPRPTAPAGEGASTQTDPQQSH